MIYIFHSLFLCYMSDLFPVRQALSRARLFPMLPVVPHGISPSDFFCSSLCMAAQEIL